MRTLTPAGCAVAALLSLAATAPADDKKEAKVDVPPVLNFTLKGIDGKDVDLAKYKGKVVLFVNVASECGYTPQYKGLQELHAKYSKDGLAVVGVPSNDFGAQEPGSNAEIAEFCKGKYHVTFDLLGKVAVAGKDPTPLYKHLTGKQTNPKYGGPVQWNFTKFLVGRKGEIAGRFEPGVEPDARELVEAVEAELAKK
jgi:glutathione peroxidase